MQDFLGRGEVFDFVAEDFDAPVQSGLVDGGNNRMVDGIAFLECFIQLEFSDHRTEGGLCELGYGDDVTRGAVARAHRIGDLEVYDAVDLQLGVVFGDADLARYIQRDFLEGVLVGYGINKRDEEVESRGEGCVVLAEAFHHPCVLLRHDADAAHDKYHGNEEDEDGYGGHGLRGLAPGLFGGVLGITGAYNEAVAAHLDNLMGSGEGVAAIDRGGLQFGGPDGSAVPHTGREIGVPCCNVHGFAHVHFHVFVTG